MTTSSWMCSGGDPADLTNGAGGHKAYPETDYFDPHYQQAAEEYRESGAAWQQEQDREATAYWSTEWGDSAAALSAAVDALNELYGDDAQESAPTVDDSAADTAAGMD